MSGCEPAAQQQRKEQGIAALLIHGGSSPAPALSSYSCSSTGVSELVEPGNTRDTEIRGFGRAGGAGTGSVPSAAFLLTAIIFPSSCNNHKLLLAHEAKRTNSAGGLQTLCKQILEVLASGQPWCSEQPELVKMPLLTTGTFKGPFHPNPSSVIHEACWPSLWDCRV